MNVLKIAQRADILVGLGLLVFAIYLANKNSYVLSGLALLSAMVSFASAKYMPARWVAKRILLARLK